MKGGLVAVIDYGVGNLHSVRHALDLVGADVIVTGDADEIARAERLVLPGVGAFGRCVENLQASGLVDLLERRVMHDGVPLFGICVGLQLLAREGYEMGVHPGLGWVPAVVKRLEPGSPGLKVPHVGWNDVNPVNESPMWAGLRGNPTFYFTHSYALVPDDDTLEAASCDYGARFTAAIQRGNIFATQFHPEKSQENGLKILENFLSWEP